MRRTLPLIAVLAGLLARHAGALGNHKPLARVAVGGHSKPTNVLETAFKIALFERKFNQGCYLPPKQLVPALRKKGIKATIVPKLKKVGRKPLVYVVKKGSNCDRVIFGTRAKGLLFILNSSHGPVYIQGQRSKSKRVSRAHPLRGVKLVSKAFGLARADQVERFEVSCPGKTEPVGGGTFANPAPGPDGEGAYPHSYERLGATRGWHTSTVLVDPSPGSTIARQVTLQVLCARGMIPGKPTPHRTIFIRPGQTKSAVARCPKGQKLFSGGFQRTDFRTPNGSYPTESRAIGKKAWQVTGRAFGAVGGELTAIAYCAKSKRPLIEEVQASTPLAAGELTTATTPACPGGRRLAAGGFSLDGSQLGFIAGGFFNPNNTWTAQAFGYFGPAPGLTAYGYCLRAKG